MKVGEKEVDERDRRKVDERRFRLSRIWVKGR